MDSAINSTSKIKYGNHLPYKGEKYPKIHWYIYKKTWDVVDVINKNGIFCWFININNIGFIYGIYWK